MLSILQHTHGSTMAPIISISSNKQCTEHCNVDPELPSKNEKRFFNLFSNIFLSPRPIDSGGRKTAGGARLPLVSSWPARIEGVQGSTPGLLDLLPLGSASGSASSLSGVLTPVTSRVSEVAPQLPELGLGPAFGIDFDSVPGWGQASALSGVSLGRRSLETANGGCMSPLPPLMRAENKN